MKRFVLFLNFILLSIFSFSQITLYNSSTREKIRGDEGVTVTFERRIMSLTNVQRHYNAFLDWGWIEGQRSSYSTTNHYTYDGTRIYLPCDLYISYSLVFRSPNYETFTLSQVAIDNYPGDGSFRIDNYNGEVPVDYIESTRNAACQNYDYNLQSEIYLVPKKIIVEGSMDVNLKTSDQSTNNLGLLSTKSIADGLQISEEDVVKLITSGQLKGKKIGDKYFVRKEDFDLFMKK